MTITEPDEESLDDAEYGGNTIVEPDEESLEEVSLEEVTASEDSLEEVSLEEVAKFEESLEETALEVVCDAELDPVAPSLVSISGTDTSAIDVSPNQCSIGGRLPFVSSVVMPFEDSFAVASVDAVAVLPSSETVISKVPKILQDVITSIQKSAIVKTSKTAFFILFSLKEFGVFILHYFTAKIKSGPDTRPPLFPRSVRR